MTTNNSLTWFSSIQPPTAHTRLFSHAPCLMPHAFLWLLITACCLLPVASLWANPEPAITHVAAVPRTDGSGIVDITYTLSDAPTEGLHIFVEVSADGGATWAIIPSPAALSGAVGPGIGSGTHAITWSSKKDLPGALGDQFQIRVTDGGPEFVTIPAGSFQMGDSFAESWSGELPVHTVTLSSFQMSKYEITNAQYARFLNAAKAQGKLRESGGVVYASTDSSNSQPWCSTSSALTGYPNHGEYSQIVSGGGSYSIRTRDGKPQDNHPMVCVSWYGAQAFCDFYGYKLPTEAQWEYAARGGLSGQRFPWGASITHNQANYWSSTSYSYDTSDTRGWHPTYNTGTQPYTAPVGSFSANGYGLHDKAGNVFEWCSEWYGESYYSISPANNPTGPTSGGYRVLRGGSWNNVADFCRVAGRTWDYPGSRGYYVGFRVSRS